jgi:homoserine O-succinyltransferase
MQFRHGQKRRPLGFKRWGVYTHEVVERRHPLVNDVNSLFDVPHSRFNDVSREQFEAAGLVVLAESAVAGVHLAVSADLLRTVYFQGHPEYDTVSLLKEYKREVTRYHRGERPDYPPFVENVFSRQMQALLDEHRDRVEAARLRGDPMPEFPEALVAARLHNTWHDTAESVVNNWMGKVYEVTNNDRRYPFMEHVDPQDPLGLRGLIGS